jgi:mRNA-degrading endonuclease toxin of MazEF toxin-antitoxin module
VVPNQSPIKPDVYKRGGIYTCNLPTQAVTETTDGRVHHRDGVEHHGPRACVVISVADFNQNQALGLIVPPITGAGEVNEAKRKEIPNTWVRVINCATPVGPVQGPN